MTNSAQFDLNALAAIKPGLDGTLAEISAHLEKYLAAPDDNLAHIEFARIELHRFVGVLKIVGLDGLSIFCAGLEAVLGDLAAHPQQTSAMHREVLRRVLLGITHHLDALANGADNATMRLFPLYQELQQLRGMEMAFELDLFYPKLYVSLPPDVLTTLLPKDERRLKALRSQYQQGLMKWLRQEDTAAALHIMQDALNGVMHCMPQDENRAFWWIGSGLLDCLAYDGLPPELNTRKLLGRIDQQLRAVIEGSVVNDLHQVMHEILYMIGRSHAVSELADAIKTTYLLDNYLPGLADLPPGEISQLLSTMRDQLRIAEENWELCAQGEKSACANFSEFTKQLVTQSEKLDRDTLQYLTKQLHELSHHVHSPEHVQLIAIDMAMALLLLRSGIENYISLGNAYQVQARLLVERMQAAINDLPEDTQKLTELVDLHYQMQMGNATIPLANEMLANLQHIEQGLSAFFNDASQRTELNELSRLLNQIQGGLHMLSLDKAEKLLISLQDNVQHFASSTNIPKPAESRALADAVSALEDYLQQLTHEQTADDSSLLLASAAIDKLSRNAAPASTTKPSQVGITAQIQRPIDEDQELLEIFLEEAQEVLGIIRDNLEISQLHPDSEGPLVTIRRGFHTLKGSGRMVGLTDFGEVAWCVERAMNNWFQNHKPSPQVLLRFINKAVPPFADWVNALKNQGGVRIEASALIAEAQCIEDGLDPDLKPAVILPSASISHTAVLPDIVMPASEPEEHSVTAIIPELPAATTSEPVPTFTTELTPTYTPEPDSTFAFEEIPAYTPVQVPAYIPEPALIPAPEEHAPKADDDIVVIGDITLSTALFNIASTEIRQNILALSEHFEKLCASTPPVVPYDFMRAAHTLVGVNRTMGFDAIVVLAHALEGWLHARVEQLFSLTDEQIRMIEQTIAALDVMTQNIANRQMPLMRNDLVEQLLGDRNKLNPVYQEPVTATPVSAEALAGAEQILVRDDVDEQLLPVFLDEADDLCPKVAAGLRALHEKPDDEQQVNLLKRLLHTIKGSSRMVGAMRIGELAHAMEDRMLAFLQQHDETGYWETLENDFDQITTLIEQLRSGDRGTEETIDTSVAASVTSPANQPAADHRLLEIGAERALHGNILRVRSDLVDRLVNEAGEISVARSRMETEVRAFKEGLLELTGSVTRLRQQLREVSIQAESQMQARTNLDKDNPDMFDPLEFDRFTRLQELTRFMSESVHDVQTIQQSLLKNTDETEAAMLVQGRLTRELQQNLMNVRMVPFNSITDRLYRTVRQTCKEIGKRANLELLGTSVELDRSVLEKMTAPFEHLLRNAIAHGLEDEQQRTISGKQPIGEIRLSVRQENNEIIFELSDDGAGLNFARLRENAIASGMLREDELASDDQLAQLIFTSGFSTAQQVTEIAGRGVGLDVVRSEIAALGGRIDVSSKIGLGVKFIIHLPLTLAVTQVLMIRAGDVTYAIPSTMVAQVRQMKSAEMPALYQERQISWQDNIYPLHYFSHLLGDTDRTPENLPRNAILLLRSGEQRIALHVDDLSGNRESVVKNIGPQLARLPGVAGATVLGNGAVVLILNPVQLAQRISGMGKLNKTEQVKPQRSQPLIMVVDDSLTMRKVTSRMLLRAGYQVVTAKDGLDALEQLEDVTPAVMLLDIEMPRMDGFALTKQLRRDPKTQNLPIVMITSRTADKHRDYALELGVNTYLGKPYQEDELIQIIAEFMADKK